MDAQKYLKLALYAVICGIVAVVGYALFLNTDSREHIEKMEAAQYSVLKMTQVDYHAIHPEIKDADITVKTLWTIDVKAQHEGVLTGIFAEIGQSVNEGLLIASISNEALGAQLASSEASIAEARASLLNNEQIVERYRQLIEYNAISQQEYDSAVAQRDASKAQLDNRIAQRDMTKADMNKLDIFAPNSAVVVNVYHKIGDYVRAGDPLFLLSDFNELQAYSILDHEDLTALLLLGREFILEVPLYRLTHRIYPITQSPQFTGDLKSNQFYARIENIVPDISERAKYHEVIWRIINNSSILEPTYYNNVTFFAPSERKILAIPRDSIRIEGNETFVYSMDADNRLIKVPVIVGSSNDEFVEIRSGLKKGDFVVTNDWMDYAEGMKVRASTDGK